MATKGYFSGSNQINIDSIVNMGVVRKQEQLSGMSELRSLGVRVLKFLSRTQWDDEIHGRTAENVENLCEEAAPLAAMSEFRTSLGRRESVNLRGARSV
jgi:hypothetical protein